MDGTSALATAGNQQPITKYYPGSDCAVDVAPLPAYPCNPGIMFSCNKNSNENLLTSLLLPGWDNNIIVQCSSVGRFIYPNDCANAELLVLKRFTK